MHSELFLATMHRGGYFNFNLIIQGGQRFYSDLAKYMTAFHSYEEGRNYVPFTSEFVRVRSYDGTESTGNGTSAHLPCESLYLLQYLFFLKFALLGRLLICLHSSN